MMDSHATRGAAELADQKSTDSCNVYTLKLACQAKPAARLSTEYEKDRPPCPSPQPGHKRLKVQPLLSECPHALAEERYISIGGEENNLHS